MSEGGSSGRWPVWRLALMLYPAAAAAVWINLFMAGLMAPVVGLPVLSPLGAVWGAVALGIPAAWAAGRWLRGLLDAAS